LNEHKAFKNDFISASNKRLPGKRRPSCLRRAVQPTA